MKRTRVRRRPGCSRSSDKSPCSAVNCSSHSEASRSKSSRCSRGSSETFPDTASMLSAPSRRGGSSVLRTHTRCIAAAEGVRDEPSVRKLKTSGGPSTAASFDWCTSVRLCGASRCCSGEGHAWGGDAQLK